MTSKSSSLSFFFLLFFVHLEAADQKDLTTTTHLNPTTLSSPTVDQVFVGTFIKSPSIASPFSDEGSDDNKTPSPSLKRIYEFNSIKSQRNQLNHDQDFPESEKVVRVSPSSELIDVITPDEDVVDLPSDSSLSSDTKNDDNDSLQPNSSQSSSGVSKTSHQSNFRSQYPSISIVVVIIGILPAAVGVFLVWINRLVCSRFAKKNKRLTSSSPSDSSSNCGDSSSRFFEMQSRDSNHSDSPSDSNNMMMARGVFLYNNQDTSKETITIQLPLNIIQGDKHGNHRSISKNRNHHVRMNVINNSSNNDRERHTNTWSSCPPPLLVKGRRRKEIVAHILAQSQENNEDDFQLQENWLTGKSLTYNRLPLKRDYHNDLSDGHSHPKLQVCRQNLELIKILGEGNFGQVWKGRKTTESNDLNSLCPAQTSSLVAVKMTKINSSPQDQQELLKEIDIMIRLFSVPSSSSSSTTGLATGLSSHANVVSLLGYCVETVPYYLILEFVEKGKLLSVLRDIKPKTLVKTPVNMTTPSCRVDDASTSSHSTSETPQSSSSASPSTLSSSCQQNGMTSSSSNHSCQAASITTTSTNPCSLSSSSCSSSSCHVTSIELLKFMYQISDGMDFITSRGIIHRDIAGRNILLSKDNVCKVADFGLARLTSTVKTVGSSTNDSEDDVEEVYEAKRQTALPIRWMAPESLFQGLFSFKTDVWSFGILVWEIVTLGSTPYPGMSASQVAKSVQVGKTMSCPNHCREEVFNLMKSCWSRESRDRPTFKEIKSLLKDMIDRQRKEDVDYIDTTKFCERNYYNEDLIDSELPEKL